MSRTDHRSSLPGARPDVALLLVTHDGARWLPAVLQGVAAQRVPIAHTVVVDTGSEDGSADLAREAFGPDSVVSSPASTTFPTAVRLGLEELARRGAETDWVWILHDDSAPAPDALWALLAGADEHPEAGILGPMLREWPSLRRLLELGVTISGTGRRETGLERGEYDQGQYVELRRVLAVNTAGMLVRRDVLEQLDGFDEELPIFGNDLDLGWRAAQAGIHTVIVPQAVVFHAEAAHRGLRRTPLTGRHTHFQERRAALFTLLANSPGRALPFRVVRLALGTLLRVLGFLLVRSPGEALDELAALASVYSSPGRLRAARRRRREAVPEPPEGRAEEVRRLLAPRWLPYRHGLDFVGDLVSAATQQAADVAERRRAAQAELDPASFAARRAELDRLEEDELAGDTGIVARFLTNPVAVLLALVVVLALVGARDAFGAVAGGGLSPAPESAGSWWSTYVSSWHTLGQGTAVPAPAYLAPLALLGTLLGGSAVAAVSVVLVLAVPLALWGAWRFLRVAGRLAVAQGAPRPLILWGATTYALVPVVAGAWGDGRLGPVVTAAVLPWLAHAALGFAEPEADRRWRAAWRTALLLALVTAFAPVAWWTVLALTLVVLGAVVLLARRAGAGLARSTWLPPLAALGVVPVLLLPWWLPAVVHGAAEGLLLDAGRLPSAAVDGVGILLGRLESLGAPAWWAWPLPLLAVAALVPRRTRVAVLLCWLVAAVAAVVAGVFSLPVLDLESVSTGAGLGFPLLLVPACLVVAVVLGALGVSRAWLAGWRRAVAGVVAALAVAGPVAGLGWFVVGGGTSEDAGLQEADTDGIPAYMVQSAEQGPQHGILVVRGSVEEGLTYHVRRGDGVTLGEDEIIALSHEDADFSEQVRAMLSRPSPEAVGALADGGVEYVVLPAPADPQVSAGLDATDGLVQASAEQRTTRAWQVDQPLSGEGLDSRTSWLRVLLLVVQAAAVVVVAVLAAPTTERSRS